MTMNRRSEKISGKREMPLNCPSFPPVGRQGSCRLHLPTYPRIGRVFVAQDHQGTGGPLHYVYSYQQISKYQVTLVAQLSHSAYPSPVLGNLFQLLTPCINNNQYITKNGIPDCNTEFIVRWTFRNIHDFWARLCVDTCYDAITLCEHGHSCCM